MSECVPMGTIDPLADDRVSGIKMHSLARWARIA